MEFFNTSLMVLASFFGNERDSSGAIPLASKILSKFDKPFYLLIYAEAMAQTSIAELTASAPF
jgi:hypothetical protein